MFGAVRLFVSTPVTGKQIETDFVWFGGRALRSGDRREYIILRRYCTGEAVTKDPRVSADGGGRDSVPGKPEKHKKRLRK